MNQFPQGYKQADEAPFAWIGDAPSPAGPYADHHLEADYQLQHPIMSMLHPLSYGAAAAGLAYGAKHGHPMAGFSGGLAAGMGVEALHRYHFLMNARRRLLDGQDPTDPRLRWKTKKASIPFEAIAITPPVAGHFADHRFEHDYQFKHPAISTFHPGPYGGALAGAALALAAKRFAGTRTGAIAGALASVAPLHAAVAGGAVGLLAEGAHRAAYLMEARRKILAKQNPVDPRFTFNQF
jgi:hypothetical protein